MLFLVMTLIFPLVVTVNIGAQPKKVRLSIIDVAGNLKLTKAAIEAFKTVNKILF